MRNAILINSLIARLLLPGFAEAQSVHPSFKKQILDPAITIGYGLAIGDVDGDGKPDVLLADKKQIVWYRNGDWKKMLIAENLTESDNVCIAAADLDGDGKVEIAVGAQWNPGETTDSTKSGAVFYLVPPHDRIGNWIPVKLPHEPTVHRMKWVKTASGQAYLVVAPLHGRGNKDGKGRGARVMAYQFPEKINSPWKITVLDSALHLTHNFALEKTNKGLVSGIYVASAEGLRFVEVPGGKNDKINRSVPELIMQEAKYGAGEISIGKDEGSRLFVATIEPMHGNQVVIYDQSKDPGQRLVIDSSLREAHALAAGRLWSGGSDQVIAGWRQPDANGKTGIRIYSRTTGKNNWQWQWLDENGIAAEDLQVADLDGNGKPEVIAAGRATKNVIIYWNHHK